MPNSGKGLGDVADAAKDLRTAEALLKTGALQSAIVNSKNFSSIATDAQGVIQIFNVGAERMLGWAATDVLNKITPAQISDPQEIIARAAALSLELGTAITPGFEALVFKASRGIEDIYELTYIRKDGSRFPALVSVTALRDVEDAVIGYLLIGTDNPARKQVEEERAKLEQTLIQKNVELEEASRMKSEFLANMSHELRTPLNAIIGFSEVLKDGLLGEMSDKQRGFIGDIFNSGKHLLSLINDILDLSKVEAGKMILDLEPVQVSSLFANSMSIIREKAAERRIRLTIDAADNLGMIEVDARKVKQIIYNLLSNAVKFTEGGQVTLRTASVPRKEVGRLSGTWGGRTFALAESEFTDFLAISVTDTGIGVPVEMLEQLFQPFSQVDSGLARRFEGTGLGLAMIKLLAELHGGIVAVESGVGEGSRFTVWLPMRASSEVILPTSIISSMPEPVVLRPGTPTALVVEDDLKSAALLRMPLEAEGFNVLHAVSAEEALELASQQPLALITLDIMLPNMDGWELLGKLKKIPELSRVPVAVISIVADRNRGFALGAAAVMQKPISRQELHGSLVKLGLFAPSRGKTLKVLIVDDDPKAVELMAINILSLAGTVTCAHGGREAIELAKKELPDVIVLDLMMPEVDGFAVVHALHADPTTAKIPILVVTSKQITAADRDKLNGGVTAIIAKSDTASLSMEVRRATAEQI